MSLRKPKTETETDTEPFPDEDDIYGDDHTGETASPWDTETETETETNNPFDDLFPDPGIDGPFF